MSHTRKNTKSWTFEAFMNQLRNNTHFHEQKATKGTFPSPESKAIFYMFSAQRMMENLNSEGIK